MALETHIHDPRLLVGTTTQARRFLGYEPIVGFEEGVKRAVAVRFLLSLSISCLRSAPFLLY